MVATHHGPGHSTHHGYVSIYQAARPRLSGASVGEVLTRRGENGRTVAAPRRCLGHSRRHLCGTWVGAVIQTQNIG